ncbi:MAG: ATP-binding cassette domain-containing protein [Clostridia bacterium]|nr:ATP-binding cassette domain-containing protein [Clostridia bacterium]
MLELIDVAAGYKNKKVLTGLNATFNNGVHAIIGPNGVGKTTLMKLLVTLLKPQSGTILYDGENILTLGNKYLNFIGYLPQDFEPFQDLNGIDYLRYIAECKNLRKDEYDSQIKYLFTFVGLDGNEKTKTKKYSGGMKKRLGLAQALLGDPQVLVLDEPTASMDPEEVHSVRRMLSSTSASRTIIISTHIISDVDEIANNIIALKDGTISKNCSPESLCHELAGHVFTVESEMIELPDGLVEVSRKRNENRYQYRYVSLTGSPVFDNAVSCAPKIGDFYAVHYR